MCVLLLEKGGGGDGGAQGGSGGARGTTRHSEDVGGLAPTSDGRSLMSEPTGTVLGGAV
jgi:hypothetical protein